MEEFPTELVPCLVEVRESPESILKQIDRQLRPCHTIADWRNYIPPGIEMAWPELSTESKVIAYLMAREQTRYEG